MCQFFPLTATYVHLSPVNSKHSMLLFLGFAFYTYYICTGFVRYVHVLVF